MIRAIISGCNRPGGVTTSFLEKINLFPSHPKYVLFTTSGLQCSLQKKLYKQLGIVAKLANNILINESRRRISQENEIDRRVRDIEEQEGPIDIRTPEGMPTKVRRMADSMKDDNDVPEDVDLKGWKPSKKELKEIKHIPMHWFCRSPNDPKYIHARLTQLWGWRTNFENAFKLGNIPKIHSILQRQKPEDIAEFIENRNLLYRFSESGLLDMVKRLVEDCHALIDGIQSPNNNPSYKPMQIESANPYGKL